MVGIRTAKVKGMKLSVVPLGEPGGTYQYQAGYKRIRPLYR